MSNAEYQLLEYMCSIRSCKRNDLLSHFEKEMGRSDLDLLLHHMEKSGFLSCDFAENERIEPAGASALSQAQDERRDKAQAQRQQRFENKVSIAQVLVPAVTFFLGLLVEHYAGVVASLAAWFEKVM